jgi:hypothetical protein
MRLYQRIINNKKNTPYCALPLPLRTSDVSDATLAPALRHWLQPVLCEAHPSYLDAQPDIVRPALLYALTQCSLFLRIILNIALVAACQEPGS